MTDKADATEAAERRVERYAEAIYDAPGQMYNDLARAAIAVADQEQAELRAEAKRRTSQAVSLGDQANVFRDRAEAAEARVAELEAIVAEVRARLLDPTAHVTEGPLIARIKVESWLRAILESGE